jgi:hypothetical protein
VGYKIYGYLSSGDYVQIKNPFRNKKAEMGNLKFLWRTPPY